MRPDIKANITITRKLELQVTLQYLEHTGWNEFREMFEYGSRG